MEKDRIYRVHEYTNLYVEFNRLIHFCLITRSFHPARRTLFVPRLFTSQELHLSLCSPVHNKNSEHLGAIHLPFSSASASSLTQLTSLHIPTDND